MKCFLIAKAKEILATNYSYDEEGQRQFDYAFHIYYQDYLKDMANQKRGFWDGIVRETKEDPKKSIYFTGMLVGYQIFKTLEASLGFTVQELESFEQLFMKKVNDPNEQQAFEREKN